ncbi:O-antigen ligase family protein [Bacillus mycoides]|uniref:O-antigen ligase-related domain-containing protein n=1 Tax=Bacillus thuringiensis serovar navarrensis TaxID=339658 RepID=A0A243AAM7_BACTU|nr:MULTISPECIES: O-antigen ligase family protein [Bacillus cereus group]MED1269346.1 O-antigen ligase family protein [Bacillus mycoides]OTY15417.1 hypothetical protein BK732_20070 [Bacillus thuringiensis serovar navarrensis]QWG69807.1 hypothetical protein EXW32_26340 [Bacillus mycoides]
MHVLDEKKLLPLLVIGIFSILSLFIYLDKVLILLAVVLFLCFDFVLYKLVKVRLEIRMVFYLLLLFIVLEQTAGLDDSQNQLKSLLNNIQKIGLSAALFITVIKNRLPAVKEVKIFTVLAVGFITVNFISTMTTYHDLKIFISTTLDYCKYFILVFIVLYSRFNDEDILKLLKLYSPIIIIGFILALLQFMGIERFFDMFRGIYNIQIRSGIYRSIGFFPYPIEFANYSCVLFCLYYYLNKYKYNNNFLLFISAILVLNILLTGTRVTLLALIATLILNSFKSFKQALKISFFLLILLLIMNNFFNLKEVISDTKTEYSSSTLSPREYYITKGFDVLADYPLFGIGFNTYGTRYYRDITGDMIFNKYEVHAFDWVKLSTTDTFVAQILPEFGIIGVLLIILSCIFVYRRYRYISKVDMSNRAYLYIIIACLILSLNSSQVLFNPHVGSLFWISIGMILSNYIRVKLLEKNNLSNPGSSLN